MQQIESLLPGKFYHIYNHAVGGRNLFREPDNYEYFLFLYDKYISPVADTYAWVLMPNHFHLLVRIKEEKKGGGCDGVASTPDRVSNPVRGKGPSLQFSKLFNSYAQAFNKWSGRSGSLFERPFKRKFIDHDQYLKNVVLYIHNNPVHHRFCSHPLEYSWSSYITCISGKPTRLKRDQVLQWFGSVDDLQKNSLGKNELKEIDMWLEIEPFHSDMTIIPV